MARCTWPDSACAGNARHRPSSICRTSHSSNSTCRFWPARSIALTTSHRTIAMLLGLFKFPRRHWPSIPLTCTCVLSPPSPLSLQAALWICSSRSNPQRTPIHDVVCRTGSCSICARRSCSWSPDLFSRRSRGGGCARSPWHIANCRHSSPDSNIKPCYHARLDLLCCCAAEWKVKHMHVQAFLLQSSCSGSKACVLETCTACQV
mmetsp:Transcript_72638/g.128341  ORF Transcript_72638/g.128341 Transcript_72638/m.128341 type:complete len:205 (+) Transcript_72638:310-924(+)